MKSPESYSEADPGNPGVTQSIFAESFLSPRSQSSETGKLRRQASSGLSPLYGIWTQFISN